MKKRFLTLMRIPVFCVCAGFLSFWLTVFMVSRFGIKVLPDGSYTSNNTFATILEIVIFLLCLGIGYFLVRNMTKKEAFRSATVIVIVLLFLQLLQLFLLNISLGLGNTVGMWLVYMTQWSVIILYVCTLITENAWIGAFLNCFIPYLFVLFGKKE